MEYTQNDVDSMALCAWKEARGEGTYGCELVMHVMYNRVGKPGFASTLHDVIYGRNQFSSMSVPSDPEFNLQPPTGDAVYAECLTLAAAVLAGSDDTSRGALWYANEMNVTSGWYYDEIISSGKHPITIHYLRHTFRA
jgi:spore germination cell wall hydrolase CwlJ-like protein